MQRYSLTYKNDFGYTYLADAELDDDGEWVHWEDVQAKLAKLQKPKNEFPGPSLMHRCGWRKDEK